MRLRAPACYFALCGSLYTRESVTVSAVLFEAARLTSDPRLDAGIEATRTREAAACVCDDSTSWFESVKSRDLRARGALQFDWNSGDGSEDDRALQSIRQLHRQLGETKPVPCLA